MDGTQVKEGEYTTTIYGMEFKLLTRHCFHLQSLYKAFMYPEAMKATFQIENPTYHSRVLKLQAAIRYGEEDLQGAKSMVEQCPSDDPDTEVNLGCLLYKEGRYSEACQKFQTAMNILGYQPDLSYNIALCYYSLKQYAPALKHIADIIERGIRDHPELSVGMTTEGIEVRSVGNTKVLHETALIEAFNLKAGIEHQLKNCKLQWICFLYAYFNVFFFNSYILRYYALERYIPVLMAQAKIYWDLDNYAQVEKIFRKSVEFCNEHEVWKLNVAHVLFMQENKYKEAVGFYEPIVKKHYEKILSVSAIVLANLCVSYIMTSANEEVCMIFTPLFPLSIWYLCFSLQAKHMIMLRDSVIQDIIQFLEHCELYGKNVPAVVEQPLEEEKMHPGKNTVTYEARVLKSLFLRLV
ncbi:PREDICTED: tetratricopeptide repeat protein 30A-like [Acropora digitifera]|uniref:tetratricopeptide repeat protein 30A-like n=1 Tax=Acropora digitifera TaxID=70779 RepID=UPI00077A7A99|nr:PREDICTED: tetratricopeptide repeat protein 30A-like [Acropora digitifera]